MALLTKDQLLGTDTRQVQEHRIKALKGSVRIREMSTLQRLKIQEYNDKKQGGEAVAYSLSVSLVDEENNPLFNMAEAKAFLGANGRITEEIMTVIADANGMNPEDLADAEKNLDGTET